MTSPRLLGPLLLAALAGCDSGELSHPDPGEDSQEAVVAAGGEDAPAGSRATPDGADGDSSAEPDASAAALGAAPAPNGMVLVPAGIYLMGSPTGGSFEERPMHEVIVPELYVDETEVTHAAYMQCVADGVCEPPEAGNPFCNIKHEGRDEHPANCIDWHDAKTYCEHVGKRLPTEREWEYFARGGQERRTFSWGEEPASTDNACYMHTGTCKVGSFAAGAFGLYDVSGNVWEWTSSWYGPYPDELDKGMFKVYRGGSWSRRFPKWLRNELRNRYEPDKYSASLGVRCVQDKSPLVCPDKTSAVSDRCERTSGSPLCEDRYVHDGTACVPDTGASAAKAAGGDAMLKDGSSEDSANASAQATPGEVTYVRSRTPQHDGDCQKNWSSTPAAYRWDGGTFHSRNPVIAAAGCVKRDMGRTWTSACCAQ